MGVLEETVLVGLHSLNVIERHFMHIIAKENVGLEEHKSLRGDDDIDHCFREQSMEEPVMDEQEEKERKEERNVREQHLVVEDDPREDEEENADGEKQDIYERWNDIRINKWHGCAPGATRKGVWF